MNTPIITRAKTYNKLSALLVAGALVVTTGVAQAEWSVDFSRRAKAIRDSDLTEAGQPDAATFAQLNNSSSSSSTSGSEDRSPASLKTPISRTVVPAENIGRKDDADKGLLDVLFDKGEPVQEIVILNTEKGFVPSTVRVRKDGRYKISVVNVNEKEKNVSFILDGFSEHHATYFGKVKTFLLEPKKDGVFSFQSPETGTEGKLVVFAPQITVRTPASN